ncbi:hypothetical protein FE810_15180 [Thalassotalea litorea]|uniref:Uncharacterized protein n=1 Tax=Thalassotalea litorea TaxID=2020715 RepID=A0A5R9IJ64_9GAMM|nr:hypothetical protein [Thalassotalea litorea]TLU61352.1 hypothetical protein FE810_15180 [Thalassotalea litorea]
MNLIFVILSLLTFVAMGSEINGFVVWNIVPMIIAAIVFNTHKIKDVWSTSTFHMILGIILLHIYFHSVMYFDIGKAATGSSTSALAYIFFPIYSVCFGGLVYLVSKSIKWILVKVKTNNSLKRDG